jgi:hypothetical protein
MELKFQDEDCSQWRYRQEKEESGKKEVKSLRPKTVLSIHCCLSAVAPYRETTAEREPAYSKAGKQSR